MLRVYGFVAAIVKLDDAGFYLIKQRMAFARAIGRALLVAAPALMKFLSVVGTAAMFMVGGSIVMHGLPFAALWGHVAGEVVAAVPGLGTVLQVLVPLLFDLVGGVIIGALVLALVSATRRIHNKLSE